MPATVTAPHEPIAGNGAAAEAADRRQRRMVFLVPSSAARRAQAPVARCWWPPRLSATGGPISRRWGSGSSNCRYPPLDIRRPRTADLAGAVSATHVSKPDPDPSCIYKTRVTGRWRRGLRGCPPLSPSRLGYLFSGRGIRGWIRGWVASIAYRVARPDDSCRVPESR